MDRPHISLISLNIERRKHLDRIIPFLSREKPDVFCAQEICLSDIPQFEAAAGNLVSFAPMARVKFPSEGDPEVMGIAIFSRLPIEARSATY